MTLSKTQSEDEKASNEYAEKTDGHFENATRWSEVSDIFLAGIAHGRKAERESCEKEISELKLCANRASDLGIKWHDELSESRAECAMLRSALEKIIALWKNIDTPKSYEWLDVAQEALATNSSEKALTTLREIAEILALMAEGEGSDEKVYMAMSSNGLAKLKKAFGI